MKSKRILSIAVIGLLFVCQLFAVPQNMQERTESWLQRSSSDATGPGGGRTGGTAAEEITADPRVPVGNGLFVVAALAGIYGLYIVRAKGNKRSRNY